MGVRNDSGRVFGYPQNELDERYALISVEIVTLSSADISAVVETAILRHLATTKNGLEVVRAADPELLEPVEPFLNVKRGVLLARFVREIERPVFESFTAIHLSDGPLRCWNENPVLIVQDF